MEIETVVVTIFMDPIATIREVLFLNGRFPLDFVFFKKNKKTSCMHLTVKISNIRFGSIWKIDVIVTSA